MFEIEQKKFFSREFPGIFSIFQNFLPKWKYIFGRIKKFLKFFSCVCENMWNCVKFVVFSFCLGKCVCLFVSESIFSGGLFFTTGNVFVIIHVWNSGKRFGWEKKFLHFFLSPVKKKKSHENNQFLKKFLEKNLFYSISNMKKIVHKKCSTCKILNCFFSTWKITHFAGMKNVLLKL